MAVYTHVGDLELAAFLADYQIGEAISYKGIAEGVENSNYLLRTNKNGGTDYILTLYEKRVEEGDLPYFLGLIDHLSDKGLACPAAVHGRDGNALRYLAGRPAAIFTFLDGLAVQRITPAHCRQLGSGLAALHLAAKSFPMHRQNNLSLEGWRELATSTKDRADEIVPGLAQLIDESIEDLSKCWPADLPSGIIHADLFPDNVFFLNNELSGFIDFYFACNDFLAYDLAICLNAWCFGPDHSFDAQNAAALFAGYAEKRPLQDAEIAAMPVLARGAALRFLLTRLFDLLNHPEGALVKPKDPAEYIAKLKFFHATKVPGDYGL